MGKVSKVIIPSCTDGREILIPGTDEDFVKLMPAAAAAGGVVTSGGGGSDTGEGASTSTSSIMAGRRALKRMPLKEIPLPLTSPSLFESPIMLFNSSQSLTSPTTGRFVRSFHDDSVNFIHCENDQALTSPTTETFLESFHDDSTTSKPVETGCSVLQNEQTDVEEDQAVFMEQHSNGFELQVEFPEEATTKDSEDSSNGVKVSNNMTMRTTMVDDDAKCLNMKMSPPDVTCDQTPDLSSKPVHGEYNTSIDISERNQFDYYSSVGVRTSEDGYNWRKYGQKQVKGSEYPRSYYKCTHPNCEVKKKVERSHDGQITEIIYKSNHNHAKPQPNRRPGLGSSAFSFDEVPEVSGGSGISVKVEGGSAWTNNMASTSVSLDKKKINGTNEFAGTPNELSDPLSSVHGKSIELGEATPEVSTTICGHDDENGATQGSISVRDDEDDDEPEAKRRKKLNCSSVETTALSSRAVREPKIVIQIETDGDILEDGYRWRKYGQKVVKGNPNPRSYYKCTSVGCPVRKHVERASGNVQAIITTYEGKHNHQVPAARNSSSHINSTSPNPPIPPTTPNNSQPPRNITIPKPEAQIHGLPPLFDTKPEFCNTDYYLRPSFPGNFTNDFSYGAQSFYQMSLPLQNPLPYGLNPNLIATQHGSSSVGSFMPDFPASFPFSFPNIGFDYSTGKSVVAPVGENDTRFVQPKQEQNDDEITYDANTSSSSSYNPFVGRF
ncbi:probable WRKY transcription factor 20 [Humulus lupulus]|uniref:probable WRKY transcription factor 20 n=1 Tax=Humulus lupulus TaxID=3486 RepID=UPI002B402D2D|nr:probable WRKY transcription factor 20 [Humulus lupulus]